MAHTGRLEVGAVSMQQLDAILRTATERGALTDFGTLPTVEVNA